VGIFDAMAAATPNAAPAEDFGPVIAGVAKAYPRLAPYMSNAVVRRGQTADDRQLEYYAPWASDNPNPGKSTMEIYNKDLQGDDLRDAVALDMLHHLGGVKPDGTPVDPAYFALKQKMTDAIMAANKPMDRDAYQEDLKKYPDSGSYEQWMAHNRADAYIRGYVNPRLNPEWQHPGIYTQPMQATGNRIREYLMTPPTQDVAK